MFTGVAAWAKRSEIPACCLPLVTLLLLVPSEPAFARGQDPGSEDPARPALHLDPQERAAIAATLARGRTWLRTRQDEEGAMRPARRADGADQSLVS